MTTCGSWLKHSAAGAACGRSVWTGLACVRLHQIARPEKGTQDLPQDPAGLGFSRCSPVDWWAQTVLGNSCWT